MSSDLPSIDPAVLAWGEYWYPIAWKGGVGILLDSCISSPRELRFLPAALARVDSQRSFDRLAHYCAPSPNKNTECGRAARGERP